MNKEQYSPYQTIELEHWKKFLHSRSAELQSNFSVIINGVRDKSLISGNSNSEICKIEFWHNAWELDFTLQLLDDQEMPIENTFGKKMLFTPNDYGTNPLTFDFIYPEELDVYYEPYRKEKLDREKFAEFFIWFSTNWIKCGGHHIGTLTTTEENSVRRIFNLNEINWWENVTYYYPKKNQVIPYPLKRNLTDLEIRKRVEFDYIPQFKTVWRYLEKQDEFSEFGIYNEQLFYRRGNLREFQHLPFEKQKFDVREISAKINALINDGFFEKHRPADFPPVLKNNIELNVTSRSREPKVGNNEVDKLQSALNLSVPDTFRFFITSIYDESILHPISQFPLGVGNWKKIKQYFLPAQISEYHELISSALKDKIPFAQTTDDELLILSCADSSVHFFAKGTLTMINDSFAAFLDSCTDTGEYFCPRRHHIEKGNISTVREWIKKGWDMKDVRLLGGKTILQNSYNDEMSLMLLENGANPGELYIYGDTISRRYLDALINHGLDLKKKLEEDKWLKEQLKKRGEFDDILKKYE